MITKLKNKEIYSSKKYKTTDPKLYRGKTLFDFTMFEYKEKKYLALSTDYKYIELSEIDDSDENITMSKSIYLKVERAYRNETNFGNLRFLEVYGNDFYVIPAQK